MANGTVMSMRLKILQGILDDLSTYHALDAIRVVIWIPGHVLIFLNTGPELIFSIPVSLDLLYPASGIGKDLDQSYLHVILTTLSICIP